MPGSLTTTETKGRQNGDKIVRFTGPTFAFQGRQVTLSGQMRYHNLLTRVEPDWAIVDELESRLANWLSKRYKGEDGRRAMAEFGIFKNLKDIPLWSYFTCHTLWGKNDSKETMGKMLSFTKYVFLCALLDDVLEQAITSDDTITNLSETADRRRHFLKTCEPLVSRLYAMQFITKKQLREFFLESEFGQAYPQFLIHLYPLFKYMKEFVASYNMLHPQQVKDTFFNWVRELTRDPHGITTVTATQESQTVTTDDVGGGAVDLQIDSVTMSGYVGAGIVSALRVLAMLDQLRVTKVMTQDENIQRLEDLNCALERNHNHIASLEKEILEGDPLNAIVVACRLKGLDFETALDQHLRDGENLRVQFQNCFDFIMGHYNHKKDAAIRRYAEIIGAATAAYWSSHTHLARFSKFDISIVSVDRDMTVDSGSINGKLS